MANKPKQIGTWTESKVVSYLIERGLNARREVLHGSYDQGDVWCATPGGLLLIVEVKGGRAAESASPEQIARWFREAEIECGHARGDLAALVTKVAGRGDARIGDWSLHVKEPYGLVTTQLKNIVQWIKVNDA